MRASILVVAIAMAGCAPKVTVPPAQALAELAKADTLLRDGCYACLQEARVIYERRQHAQGMFDAALLLHVREKELGVPTTPPSLAQPTAREAALIAAAQLLMGEVSGLDPVQRAAITGVIKRPIQKDNPARRALDPLFGSDLAATYIALSIDCESAPILEGIDLPALMKTYENVPLMQFRLARCGLPPLTAPLVALRKNDPRWNDTLFWEGRRAIVGSATGGIDLSQAIALYGEGRAAFPTSLALAMAWSQANLSAEEFEPALSGFNGVVAAFPEHRDALIGKVQALSYLLRHQDGVEAATTLIELGTWHIGDAYYWRAWNRYHLKEYESAWADVENATRGVSNARVFMLAGLIAYARTQLETAEQRFDRAYQVDSSACDALWMSGLVSIDRTELGTAAPKFTKAMTCFISVAASLRQNRERLEQVIAKRGTPATDRETRQMDRFARDAENADEKSAFSAFNAAQCYARTGGRGMALNLVDVAIAHPRMEEKARALKAAIEKLPK
jgi:tetratricopeptide (TPR) repeat protein